MSPKKKSGPSVATPEPLPQESERSIAAANPANSARLTPAEVEEWLGVLKRIGDNKFALPAILAAGVAAMFEVAHVIWLFGKWLYYLKQ